MQGVDDVTDRRSVCAPIAEDLRPDVPYVRGWAQGKRGADALAEVLRALGLEEDIPSLRADVNVHGDGVVCLGDIRPYAAELLTRALTAGLSAEMAQNTSTAGADGVNSPPDASAA
jgi:hypothetical protein